MSPVYPSLHNLAEQLPQQCVVGLFFELQTTAVIEVRRRFYRNGRDGHEMLLSQLSPPPGPFEAVWSRCLVPVCLVKAESYARGIGGHCPMFQGRLAVLVQELSWS